MMADYGELVYSTTNDGREKKFQNLQAESIRVCFLPYHYCNNKQRFKLFREVIACWLAVVHVLAYNDSNNCNYYKWPIKKFSFSTPLIQIA